MTHSAESAPGPADKATNVDDFDGRVDEARAAFAGVGGAA